MEFMMSARGWQECIALGNMEGYRVRFEETAEFFKDRFQEANVIGKKMIEMITKKTTHSSTPSAVVQDSTISNNNGKPQEP